MHDKQPRPWLGTSALSRRAPIILCLLYATALFYGKAFAHYISGIPHIGNVDKTIPFALAEITMGLLPVVLLMLINPIAKATSSRDVDRFGERSMILVSLGISVALFIICVARRGGEAFHDFYGNRLLIDHGALAPIPIVAMSYITCTAVALAFSQRRFAIFHVLLTCIIWGVLLSKGFMLAYPLMAYVGLRAARRRKSILPLVLLGTLAIVAVVILGRLRAGASLEGIADDGGLSFLLLLALYRVDQLDSFALVLEHGRLAYSTLPVQELADSLSYLLPRGALADKPLSFSMEMTKLLRPEVYASDAANNFTLFSQTYMLGGPYGPILAFSILLGFFVSMGLLQRWLFRSHIEFWAFCVAVWLPCFMALVSAGLFHEYILLQVPLSLLGIFAFRLHFRRPRTT